MATLNGTILNTTGSAPDPCQRWPRGCPWPGPVPVTQPGQTYPVFAHSHIYFWPQQTPYVDGAAVVTTGPVRARIDGQTGAFSVTLNQGNYECHVGRDCFEIAIPTDVGVFNLTDVLVTELANMPPASNTYQGTFPSGAADFVLPANPVGDLGNPVATGWTQNVQGPGKFQVEAAVMILATSRDGNQEDNEIYTAYLWDATDAVMVGQEVTVQNIFTGTQGQLILRGTVNIIGATALMLEVYAAGNPNTQDLTAAPLSVGTVKMAQSSISITRLS